MTDDAELGPIDYLVVEFPGSQATGEGLPLLVDLVDRGTIRILDLVFLRKDDDSVVTTIPVTDLSGDLDLSVFEGVSSGLLDEDDLVDAATVIDVGSTAGILVYENSWAGPFVEALRRGGGQLVSSGRIPPEALAAALNPSSDSDA